LLYKGIVLEPTIHDTDLRMGDHVSPILTTHNPIAPVVPSSPHPPKTVRAGAGHHAAGEYLPYLVKKTTGFTISGDWLSLTMAYGATLHSLTEKNPSGKYSQVIFFTRKNDRNHANFHRSGRALISHDKRLPQNRNTVPGCLFPSR
jgi:hypothetical protein